jgi:hypothetical protein
VLKSKTGRLTVLYFLQGLLKPFNSLVVLIPFPRSSLELVSEVLQLLLQLGFLLRQALSQRTLVHSQHFPILHSLFCVLKLFSRIRFARDEFIAFLDPVLLRKIRSAAQITDLRCLCFVLLPQLRKLLAEAAVLLLQLGILIL